MVQRARETSGRLSRTRCKSWPLPFLTHLALPDIPEQYMRALQDARMCSGAAPHRHAPRRLAATHERVTPPPGTCVHDTGGRKPLRRSPAWPLAGIVKSLSRGSPRDPRDKSLGVGRASPGPRARCQIRFAAIRRTPFLLCTAACLPCLHVGI